MALITPDKFTALKTAVKNECLRRCQTGSVADYGGETYDYSRTPLSDTIVAKEFYEKVAIPLNAIKGNIPTSGGRVINDGEIDAYQSIVDTLSDIAMNASSTGCAASCTGLCSSACVSGCTSCTGGCTGTCSGCSGCGGCDGDCWGCSGGCYSCTGSCTGGCTGCSDTCEGCQGCTDACTGCSDYCGVYCSSTCYNGGSCNVMF